MAFFEQEESFRRRRRSRPNVAQHERVPDGTREEEGNVARAEQWGAGVAVRSMPVDAAAQLLLEGKGNARKHGEQQHLLLAGGGFGPEEGGRRGGPGGGEQREEKKEEKEQRNGPCRGAGAGSGGVLPGVDLRVCGCIYEGWKNSAQSSIVPSGCCRDDVYNLLSSV